MIYLELPPKVTNLQKMAHGLAKSMFRPISRKYDRAEHERPKELDAMKNMMGGSGGGMGGLGGGDKKDKSSGVKNGGNMIAIPAMIEMCWGDAGLAMAIPGQGLGNAAIMAAGTPEQKEEFGKVWAAMAITEPGTGSDAGNIKTTAKKDGDDYIINGEKIYVTGGGWASHVVVWANIDPSKGKAGIKSFVVSKDTPGVEVVRLEKKLGIRASDTAAITFTNARVPARNLLGSAEIKDKKEGFGGVMQTFDNTRPAVAAMSLGVSKAALDLTRELLAKEGVEVDYGKDRWDNDTVRAELEWMESEWEGARLLTMKAAWMADNGQPNSKEASMSKAKAGRVGNYIVLRCVELCQSVGYSERELLEKFARDQKIMDIFEGTQQIQQLIVARQILGKSSKELK
ncbi:MAG: acyl-CoA dehydrogenase family protein [Pseudomonadota bacterium]|nr:acyl-CoA dehydrogenase family protein [Pseudomonadota bacterium]HJO35710.1 acyl-CoA dehydrogenase family protein [Gammaproteobacteria bacterium]